VSKIIDMKIEDLAAGDNQKLGNFKNIITFDELTRESS
jgi:hypothetical protein